MPSNRWPASSDVQFTSGRFKDKIVVVTGGASGIGRAAVERFASDGACVALLDISKDQGLSLEKELRASGYNVTFYFVDVADRQNCVAVIEEFANKNGGAVHLLVNNAAYMGHKGIEALDADWRKTMEVNVQGYSNMAQACYPYMIHAGKGRCAIVNVASCTAYRPKPMQTWTYCSSKGAVISLTKCMALDFAKDGIRVNSVSPGWIYSESTARIVGGDREKAERDWGRFHMLYRLGDPSEVASVVTFLCSNDASFMTAVDVPVDGGYLALSAEGIPGDD